MHFAELLRPCLRGRVPRSNWLIGEWVDNRLVPVLLAILVNLEQLASTVAEKLVKGDDQGETLLGVLDEHVLVILGQELDGRLVGARVHIAQIDVLEALALANVIVVWNVDADWGARAAEGNDL